MWAAPILTEALAAEGGPSEGKWFPPRVPPRVPADSELVYPQIPEHTANIGTKIPRGGDMSSENGSRKSLEGSSGRGTSQPPHTDWESPRWREDDDAQGDVERGRRLRGNRAPAQRGAIDESGSIGPESSDESRGSEG